MKFLIVWAELNANQSDSMEDAGLEMDTDAMVDGAGDPADEEDNNSLSASTLAFPGPALPKSNSSVRGNGKRKTEAKRRCRMCTKWQPEDCFPVNSTHCRDCKQAVDNLAKQACRQNQSEYWKEVRNNEQELKKLVARYMEACPKQIDKGKRGNFSLASYREVYSATTNSGAKAKGRMMWEGYYVEFAQKAKGGAYTEEEARKRWKEMLEDPAIDKDNLGPSKAPRRCCVSTYDEVSHGSKLTHGKQQDLQTRKDTKNVSPEQAAKDRRALLHGHERGALNKHGEVLDFQGAMAGMLSSSACGTGGKFGAGGSSFAGHGAFIPDLAVLRSELQEKKEAGAGAEDPTEEAGKGDNAGGNAPEDTEKGKRGSKRPSDDDPPLPKKARWFDVDAARSLETCCLQSLMFFCASIL